MHPVVRFSYALAGHLARGAASITPASGGKVLASLHARRGIRARYAAWRGRDPTRPLLWVHAPSVGEGLQAQPVIARLRERHPELQLAYTFYSPSAAAFARASGADFADYLPFDTADDADAALDALRPTALVFGKLDVWPLLVARAAARSVPVGLIAATFSSGSGRASRPAALLLGDAYRLLNSVGAIDERDAARLAALGVARDRLTVTGDPRYDQAWSRAQATNPEGERVDKLRRARFTLVAGSTWPSDETPLLEAWLAVRARTVGARLVIAPHEPTAGHLSAIERWARRAQITIARFGTPAEADADVLLVDRVGVLGDLYAAANAAYVGGAFHAAGLHSVLEPAAFGAPVLFGPRHLASRDAQLLLASGGGFAADSAQKLSMRILALSSEPAACAAAGNRARTVVRMGLGAADRSADLVEALLARATDGAAATARRWVATS